MREIKFRAWNINAKRFSETKLLDADVYLRISDGVVGTFYTHEDDSPHFAEEIMENTIIMQFTGLKDKNGKEIYEGDIVKMDWLMEEYNIGTVVFTKLACFKICSSIEHDFFGMGRSDKDLEVIGNIYENPELLEAKE